MHIGDYRPKKKSAGHIEIIKMRNSIYIIITVLILAACARMGHPDGGWYDETPPSVVGADPADKAIRQSPKKVRIMFDEFIKIDNATENVVVSPPQLEQPEIKATGRSITVELKDTLQENVTYTIDFSDAITDNNEGNPLGNYTYSFSTGDHIDTLEVSGYVLDAENLEPVKGIIVGLYDNFSDSALQTQPMKRVARTDSRGHFVIKGVGEGVYRAAALQDADGNYLYNQRSEMLAFSMDTIRPTWKPDVRQDTIWADSLHIRSIDRVSYTHYLPDDVCLRAFTAVPTEQYLIKAERKDPQCFTLFYGAPADSLPILRGLNFNSDDAFIIEPSEHLDTISYWIKDTTLVNTDSLTVELTHMISDSSGVLRQQCDTLELIPSVSYEQRLKKQADEIEKWKKNLKKKLKRGETVDTVYHEQPMEVDIRPTSTVDPDQHLTLSFKQPLSVVDTSKIHLYQQVDTLWEQTPYVLDTLPQARTYAINADWEPDTQYSLELDSMAFVDIYGLASGQKKQGLKVKSLDEYSSLVVTIVGMDSCHLIVQMINRSGKMVKETETDRGVAEFYYVTPDTYYLRLFVDANNNGRWDTGDYASGLQPEEVFYYPEEIECREKWDVSRTWNPRERPLFQQKPAAITKQKGDKQKIIKQRNLERARKLGIEYLQENIY